MLTDTHKKNVQICHDASKVLRFENVQDKKKRVRHSRRIRRNYFACGDEIWTKYRKIHYWQLAFIAVVYIVTKDVPAARNGIKLYWVTCASLSGIGPVHE